MKKILFITGVAMLFVLASCSKDRVCECKYNSTNPNDPPYTETYTMVDVNKKSAKANCVSVKQVSVQNGTSYNYTRDCTIK